MAFNILNSTVRFFLEVSALVAYGMWGWSVGDGFLRYLFAAGLPVVAASLWGVLAVPNDPSRSGDAPVPISGLARLILEIGFFATATWVWVMQDSTTVAWIFALSVCAHYVASHQRVIWLVRQKTNSIGV